MNTSKKIAIMSAAVVLLFNLGTTGASAQSATDCSCVIPGGASSASAGTINSVTGQVLVSQPEGFVPAVAGTSLQAGGKLIVGPQSRAIVSFGPNCPVNVVPENLDLTLLPEGGDLCIRLTELDVADETLPLEEPMSPLQAGVLGGIAAGAAVSAVALSISD